VALLNRREQHHAWASETVSGLPVPFVTCDVVISEVCFLLSAIYGAEDALLALVEGGRIVVPFRLDRDVASVRNLMRRYRSVPMSFADACLVRLSECIPDSRVLTLDGDFFVYRKHGNEAIDAIAPLRP